MTSSKPIDLRIVIACSTVVTLGCVATYLVVDRRIRQERDAMRETLREEMKGVVKDGIKRAADDMLTTEYVETKVSNEAKKILADPPVEAAGDAAKAGVKTGAKATNEALKSITENEEDLREIGKNAGKAARVGLETVFDAAKEILKPPKKQEGEAEAEKK